MRFRRLTTFVFALGVVALLLPADASAGIFRIRVEEVGPSGVGTGVVVTDQFTGDGSLVPGFIHLAVGSLASNVTTSISLGISAPILPVAPDTLAHIVLQSFNVNATGATTVRITLEDTGFTNGLGQTGLLQTTIGGNFAAPVGTTLTTQSWANASNYVPDLGPNQTVSGTLPAIGPLLGTATSPLSFTFNGDEPHFSDSTYSVFEMTGPTPYSLFTQVVITFTGAGSADFTQNTLVAAPEPGSLLLLGTGLVGVARMVRRRRGNGPPA
jgi:hypothetical protein